MIRRWRNCLDEPKEQLCGKTCLLEERLTGIYIRLAKLMGYSFIEEIYLPVPVQVESIP